MSSHKDLLPQAVSAQGTPLAVRQTASGMHTSQLNGQGLDPLTGLKIAREFSIHDILSMLVTHIRLIAVCTVAAALLAFLYAATATRIYTASATLEVSGYSPILPGNQIESIIQQQSKDQNYLATQVAKITNLSVADEVLSDAALQGELSAYFDEHRSLVSSAITYVRDVLSTQEDSSSGQTGYYKNNYDFLIDYLDLVSVSPVYGTSLVDVSVSTASPELSQKLANAHVEGFIDHLRNERRTNLIEKLTFLKKEGDELERKVAEAEITLAQYAEDNQLVSLSEDENIVIKELSELTKILSETTARRIESESILNEMKQRSLEETNSLDNEAVRDLIRQLNLVEAEYADLGKKVTPLYPKMIQLKARIDTLKSSIRSSREQAFHSLEARYQSDVEAEKDLERKIAEKTDSAHKLSKRLVKYNILKREYDSLKDLNQSVIRQRKEAQLSSANTGSSVSVGDFAPLPSRHSYPRGMAFLIFGTCLGCAAGVLLALFKEIFNSSLVTAEDIANVLTLPVIGTIPSFGELPQTDSPALLPELKAATSANEESIDTLDSDSEDNRGIQKSPVIKGSLSLTPKQPELQSPGRRNPAGTVPFQIAFEAFRTLRTVMLLSSADNPPRTIMVSSATKGDGKTTVCSNLAMSLSRNEDRVLLIDADIRQPSIADRFGIHAHSLGLVDYLAGQATIDAVTIRRSEYLDIIPAGSIAPNPTELFSSKKMASFISEMRDKYDYVLFDSAPVVPVADSLALSTLLDGVLLVVRSRNTQKHLASEATRRLRHVQATLLGVVLNDVNEARNRYGAYNHNYGSDYYIANPTETGGRRVVGQ